MRNSMIGRYLDARDKAIALNDTNLIRECDHQLNRLGWRPEAPERAEQAADAEARPRRGRPPLHRDA